MRKIESKQEREKRRKRNSWIIGGILIFIMLGSTFGYAFFGGGSENEITEKINYNGYEFVNQNDFWVTSIGDYQFIFRYNPTQVEKISSEVNLIDRYANLPVYINSEDYVSEVEIYRNLGNIVERFQGACLQEEGCEENWPIKDCSSNFIIIRVSNNSNIYQYENCVFIEGKQENLTQLTDEFLFKILGIEKLI